MRTLFVHLLAFFALVSPALAEPVTATLLTDLAAVEPGKSLRAGIYFKMEPGWHIYWKDPGDSGLPTKLSFELPQGYKASDIYWPRHEEFVMPGNIKINGYENEVLLWSDVQVPASATGVLKLKLKVSWLNCSATVCVPQRKTFEKDIALGKVVHSEDVSLFNTWATKVPKE